MVIVQELQSVSLFRHFLCEHTLTRHYCLINSSLQSASHADVICVMSLSYDVSGCIPRSWLGSCPCDFNVVTPVLLWQLKVCAVQKPIVLYYLTEFKCIFKHLGYAFLLLSNHKLISFNVISCQKDVCVFILQPLINSIVILLHNLDRGNCSRRKHGTGEMYKALPFLHCSAALLCESRITVFPSWQMAWAETPHSY